MGEVGKENEIPGNLEEISSQGIFCLGEMGRFGRVGWPVFLVLCPCFQGNCTIGPGLLFP